MEERKRILIFVNDEDDERMFSLFLQHHGFSVEIASSPEDCIQVCKGNPPNLLLTSRIGLISGPGLQFIQQLRSDPSIPNFPILVGRANVANGDSDYHEEFALGANGAFGYAFDLRKVLKEIHILLKNPQSTGISDHAIKLTAADYGYRPDIDR